MRECAVAEVGSPEGRTGDKSQLTLKFISLYARASYLSQSKVV